MSLAVLACEAFVIVPRTAGSRQQPALVFRKRYPTARPLPEALAAAKERLVQRGARVVVESEGRVRLALPYAAGKRVVAIVSADSSSEQPALILRITLVDAPENAYAIVRRLRLAVAAAAGGGDPAETEAAPDAAADAGLDAAAPDSGTPADAGVPATIPVQEIEPFEGELPMSIAMRILVGLSFVGLGACVKPPESRGASGLVASEDPRVWVVRQRLFENQTISEVFRCADGAKENAPPKPVCVKAPMVDER